MVMQSASLMRLEQCLNMLDNVSTECSKVVESEGNISVGVSFPRLPRLTSKKELAAEVYWYPERREYTVKAKNKDTGMYVTQKVNSKTEVKGILLDYVFS